MNNYQQQSTHRRPLNRPGFSSTGFSSIKFSSTGFSLIELLVAVSIMVILAAMMIPRIRVFNEDRNIREAARVGASIVAAASQRAINERATAGLLIERHPNFIDSDGVNFAGTTLYEMRSVPPYLGDDSSVEVTRTGDYTLTIPYPLEFYNTTHVRHDYSVIKPNDRIRVNNGSIQYQIVTATPDATLTYLTLALSQGEGADYLPPLPGSNSDTYPFVVHRQPRKLESSRVELPDGFQIDLRYSGPINATPDIPLPSTPPPLPYPPPRCWFHEAINTNFNNQEIAHTIQIIFQSDGSMDRVYFYNPDTTLGPNGGFDSKIPLETLHLLITKIPVDPFPKHGLLELDTNYWVSIRNNGGVSIAYNAGSTGNVDMDGDGNVGTLGDRILEARGLTQGGMGVTQ